MKKNIGIPDRIIRLLIATVLLGLAIWQWSWILLASSIFIFYEALAGWCVLYQLTGRNTCPIDKEKK